MGKIRRFQLFMFSRLPIRECGAVGQSGFWQAQKLIACEGLKLDSDAQFILRQFDRGQIASWTF